MNSADFDIPGRVTKRYVEPTNFPTASDPLSVDPAVCTYDIVPAPQFSSRYQFKLTAHLPKRRISKGARIIPAEVGDPCWISRAGANIFAVMLTEGIPMREACP